MKVIFIALAMLALPAPVLAQETGVLVAQAGVDNRPSTLGDLHRTEARLDRKIEDTRRDLGARIDTLAARIDTLTTAVWAILGGIIAALLGVVVMQMRREKTPEHSAPPSGAPASAPR